jgi:peptide/nickel transport system permease protein
MDYILAARAVGAGHWRIIFHHMVPNVFAVYLVIATFYFAGAIIAEASLSFLGVGSPPNVATWGGMLTGATSFIRVKWSLTCSPCTWLLLPSTLREPS